VRICANSLIRNFSLPSPRSDVSQSSRLSIIKKIQRHLLGNSPRATRSPGKKRAQELPTTLSRTEAFKETRQQSTKKRLQELQSQITKLLPSTERLAESDTQFDPIANFDSWNPLKKLVISNKETWNACGECGEFVIASLSSQSLSYLALPLASDTLICFPSSTTAAYV
jgi:hypothetical protein